MAEAMGVSALSAHMGMAPKWGGLWDTGEQDSTGVPGHTEEGGAALYLLYLLNKFTQHLRFKLFAYQSDWKTKPKPRLKRPATT